MSKPYSSLPEALKGITSQMGDNILEDIKLVNILSDVYSIEDIPAAKTILKIMVSEGYCSEILSSKDDPSWKIKGKMISAKITAQNGFKESITDFLLDSMFYALGKIEDFPQIPLSATVTSRNVVDLEIELKKLKGEYLTFLEDNVVVSDDNPAYFETNDKSEIFEYQGKIEILNSVLGKKDLSWCKERYNEVIKKYTPVPPQKIGFFRRLFG